MLDFNYDNYDDVPFTLGEDNPEKLVQPNLTDPMPTEQDLLNDLLFDIEQQEIDELNLNEVTPAAGIASDQQAEFFIRRYKRLKDTEEMINNTADQQIKAYREKVDNWRESELHSVKAQMDYISLILESYAKTKLTGKKKSVKMIEGTLGFSKQQPKFDWDDKKLREFLSKTEGGSQYLEPQEPKVKWGEFKKAGDIDSDGIFRYNNETVPGVVVTTRPDKFSVK